MKFYQPPQDLAGYQNIVIGCIQDGDVLVSKHSREKFWAKESAGVSIPNQDYDVYRKMDVPRHDAETKPGDYGDMAWINEPVKAKTDDGDKPPLAKLPWKALRKVSGVQAYGHKKYKDYYNYKKGMEVTRQISCAIRHLSEYLDGNDLDSESGQSHLAHAATRILFAIENVEDGTAIDDRYKKQ